MRFFRWLGLSGGDDDPGQQSNPLPWETHPSIYEHLRAHTDGGREELSKEAEGLPDEGRWDPGPMLRWCAGAMDGVTSHHMSAADSRQEATALLNLIRTYCTTPTYGNKLTIHEHLMQQSVLPLIDPLLKLLAETRDINTDRLFDLAKSFATESPDREPVKLGIALLGLRGDSANKEIFRTLGLHDEFTLYCAVAMMRSSEDYEADLWELARKVHGWGRIALVERLASTRNPRLKEWLLREGFRNTIMYAYLAYTCATSGGLRDAITREVVDDEILNSAGQIIKTLLEEGPAESMDDYEDGAFVVQAYLEHLARRPSTIDHLSTVIRIREWLADSNADWTARQLKNWTPERRTDLLGLCKGIIEEPSYQTLTLAALTSNDDDALFEATEIAPSVGIDAWPYLWKRLHDSPTSPHLWYYIMNGCTEPRIADVVRFAGQSLPLDAISEDPQADGGPGEQNQYHQCLDFILQDLRRFPGHGETLIRAGIRSTAVRNRHIALSVLAAWGRSHWPTDMEQVLQAAWATEPHEQVKTTMKALLEGRPSEPAMPDGDNPTGLT